MIDLLICVALGIGLYSGYRKGVVRQLGSLVALFAAVLACHLFGDTVAGWAASLMGVSSTDMLAREEYMGAALIGNIVLFVIVWWGAGILTNLLHDLVKAICLGGINSLIGAVLMALKVLVAVSILLNLWLFKNPDSKTINDGGPITQITTGIAPALMGIVRNNF